MQRSCYCWTRENSVSMSFAAGAVLDVPEARQSALQEAVREVVCPARGCFCGLDARGPRSRVTLRRPLARRIDPHLAAVGREIRRVIEVVDRVFRHLDVAKW